MRKWLIYGLILPAAALQAQSPVRLTRAESFFGLHFDFHAEARDTLIGERVTPEMVQWLIDEVRPDFIQIDCKGHPGYSSYPTRVGNSVGKFVRDPLRIWREVTARNGVALYMHYSGVIDQRACALHPNWAIKNDSDRRKWVTSVFGPYADSLLIPQLKELAGEYGVDGVWVDGENWGILPDYGEKAVSLFREKYNVEPPRRSSDPYWFEWQQFHRQAFRDYLYHYVTEIHKAFPKFQIASNWAYSSFMPEKVTIPVDYLSGDYTPLDAVNRARLEARILAQQGLPWDLMAWGFSWNGNDANAFVVKMPTQMMQEAAAVLAQGGGFQMYLQQRNDASIYEWTIPLAKETAKFCRARQLFCHRWQPVPQIGLILHTEAFYRRNPNLFGMSGPTHDHLQGILQCLLDSQQVVDVVMDHTLSRNINDYPLLIWPEWETITPDMKSMLLSYVERGGKLLVIGPKAAKLFEAELRVKLLDEPTIKQNGLEANGWIAVVNSLSQDVQLSSMAKPFGRYYHYWNKEGEGKPAASIASYGRGKLAAVYLNLGERCRFTASVAARQFLAQLVRELYPDPLVQVTGSTYVDVSVLCKGDQLGIHLVNTAGPHAVPTIHAYDEIPPVGPLTVTLRLDQKPKRLTLQPQNRTLRFFYKDGKAVCTLDRLAVYDIIVVE
ncbi:MAG: hypothetical protein ONB24_01325 [candidate division KSB1 bacterium]|nr:hypothetical protein [candidate division KSB1 bacterium]